MPKTTEQFIEDAKLVHGNKYDYSLVEYKNNRIKIKIKCNTCGNILEQEPSSHLRGRGCPDCATKKRTKLLRNNINDLIDRANLVHNNKYDYCLVEYKTIAEQSLKPMLV